MKFLLVLFTKCKNLLLIVHQFYKFEINYWLKFNLNNFFNYRFILTAFNVYLITTNYRPMCEE